jgi:flagellar motor switch protein FliM
MRCFLAKTTIKLNDLMSLQPGDIITTEKEIGGDAFVEVEGKHKFLGQLGQFRGKRSIRVTVVTTERAEMAVTDQIGASR